MIQKMDFGGGNAFLYNCVFMDPRVFHSGLSIRWYGGLAYIGLTILILSEVGQNRQKGAKLSWKKV